MKFLNDQTPYADEFYQKAKDNQRPLYYRTISAQRLVKVIPDKNVWQGWRAKVLGPASDSQFIGLSKGDSIIFDFGENVVGHLSLLLQTVGAPQDAPAHLRLTMGEILGEVADDQGRQNYNGWLSSSWLQYDEIKLDQADCLLKMPRRYTFRYLKVTVLDTSIKYQIKVNQATVKAQTAADPLKTPAVITKDSKLAAIDRTALRTLVNNMQDTYEDAPKRDRRLWLGDFWETVKANYWTYSNFALSRRCLYLFAAGANQEGQVPGDLFIVNGRIVPDNIYWVSWLLLYGAALYDYYEASMDRETLKDLYPTALRQIDNVAKLLSDDGLLPDFKFSQSNDEDNGGTFVDWNDQINGQAATQGLMIYVTKQVAILAGELGKKADQQRLQKLAQKLAKAAAKSLWDDDQQIFVSGHYKQVSTVSQIWLIKAGILDETTNQQILKQILNQEIKLVHDMPFNENLLLEDLFENDLRAEGIAELKRYYGFMIDHGADTFWEIMNFTDARKSPYGSYLVNSYCHGWGSYPSYLIRKFGLDGE